MGLPTCLLKMAPDALHMNFSQKNTSSTLKKRVIENFRDHVSSGKVAVFEKYGIDFVTGRRQGAYLWDIDGKKRLFNLHFNGGVFNLGHRNEELIGLLKDSLDELDIGNHHLLSEQRAALGRRLAELAPGDLAYTTFAVGGGEAIDFDLKLARAADQGGQRPRWRMEAFVRCGGHPPTGLVTELQTELTAHRLHSVLAGPGRARRRSHPPQPAKIRSDS